MKGKGVFFIIVSILFMSQAFGQRKLGTVKKSKEDIKLQDSLDRFSNRNSSVKSDDKGEIEQYLINFLRDSTYVDTTLSIQKDYKFNYLRKDEFGLMPFANAGQTYNSLKPIIRPTKILPLFGARARHYNYMEVWDINYYQVPTPLSELFFKTVFEQGQILDAFITINTSRQLNMSIAYKGARSLGNYQNALTSTGNLRMTANYISKNNRYVVKAHATWQDLLNEENGGLTEEEVETFESGDEDFLDRALFDLQFQNAESILEGRRFYLDQEYALIKLSDSTFNDLRLTNKVSFEDKDFLFDQLSQDEFFGAAFSNEIRDKVSLQNFQTELGGAFKSKLGELYGGLAYSNFNYGYDFATIIDDQVILNRITGNTLGIEGSYRNNFGPIMINTSFQTLILGDFDGYTFSGDAQYRINQQNNLYFGITSQSSVPNYNTLLNQSSYLNYNWYNLNNFNNERSQRFSFGLESKNIADVYASFRTVENYTYFTVPDGEDYTTPIQSGETVSHFDITIDKKISLGNFNLDNRILFQQVTGGEGVLNIPDLVLRNSLYYSNGFFKNDALFLQTGITFNYFTEYFADGYDPLLAEFYTQNDVKIGNFPRLDFFIDAKVRQTRIFLKAEHLNAAFTGYKYFAAPNYPYRDFNIRFGLVWNFFL